MHYTTVKDAALCTALAAMTGWWQPRDAPQAVMCYIFIFILLLVAFETARDWQHRACKKKKPLAPASNQGLKNNNTPSL
ncbi:hypothetical protein RO787_11560 [Blautia coccoides]|uniref:hypothetical protein n=1 Tax=Blautia producta TaxID=33035 RepID=UPI0028A3D01A|nr:hypothetical protein [Blautia coccoides]MDT4373982.1 hypothetical protein [Blautia coccoides]